MSPQSTQLRHFGRYRRTVHGQKTSLRGPCELLAAIAHVHKLEVPAAVCQPSSVAVDADEEQNGRLGRTVHIHTANWTNNERLDSCGYSACLGS